MKSFGKKREEELNLEKISIHTLLSMHFFGQFGGLQWGTWAGSTFRGPYG